MDRLTFGLVYDILQTLKAHGVEATPLEVSTMLYRLLDDSA